jgi:hypothetical protein
MYIAKKRFQFLYSRDALVDILTVTPIFVQVCSSSYHPLRTGDNQSSGFLRFARVVKILRVFRLVRLLKAVKVLSSPIEDAIRMKMIELGALMVSIIIIIAGIVQFLAQNFGADWGGCEPSLENITIVNTTTNIATTTIQIAECPALSFHDALYFTFVTVSSVGYGDISPKDSVGRMCMVIMIIFSLVVVLPKCDEMSQLLSFRSRYGGFYKGSSSVATVLLGCDANCCGIAEFLQQFFHEDHCFVHSHLVVLCPAEPDTVWKALMLKHKKRLTYLKGDMADSRDLARAKAETCLGCFILANHFCGDTNVQDGTTISRAIAVHNYNHQIKAYVELIEPENRKYLVALGFNTNRIICHNQLKVVHYIN